MRHLRTTLARMLLACAFLTASLMAALPAHADDEADARRLLVEAVRLADEAAVTPDPMAEAELLEQSADRLERIVDDYPGSEIAVMIVTGQSIGNFEPEAVRRRLAEVRADAGAGAEEPAMSPAAEPPHPALSIPVAPVDENSVAGRILYAIAETLDGWFGSDGLGPVLRLDSPMTSVDHDGTVIVTAPGARLVPEHGEHLILGDLALKVRPRGENEYSFEAGLPPEIYVREEDGRNEGRITIADSAIFGMWRADLETATAFDVDVRDIRIIGTDLTPEGRVTDFQIAKIGAVETTQYLIELGSGLWDGRYNLSVRDVMLDFEQEEGLRIGSVTIDSDVKEFDLAATSGLPGFLDIMDMQEEMDPTGAPPEGLQKMIDALQTLNWGVSDSRIAVTDLAVREDNATIFELGEIIWEIMFDGRDELIDLGMVIGVKNLEGAEELESELPPELVPDAVRLGFTLHKFPFRTLIAKSQDVAGAQGGPPMSEAEAQGMLMSTLVEAGTTLDIDEISVLAPLFNVNGSGALAIDPTSAMGVVGALSATIEGLDKLVQLAAKQSETNPEAEEMMGFFIFLQGLGKPILTEDSESPVYSYDLSISADGMITVNETPLDFLFGGNGNAALEKPSRPAAG